MNEDIERFDDGDITPNLTEEEQLSLEEEERERKEERGEIDYPPYTAYSRNTPEIDKL